jgi:hypothetical protein
MNVYMVEDVGNSPGKVYAVFADKETADWFSSAVSYDNNTETLVVERTLFYGQPPICGYNK